MKCIDNNLYTCGKNSLCVGTDNLNINNLPKIIKKYISDAIINREKMIFFTDDISYKNIKKNFNSDAEAVINNVNSGNLKIKTYSIVDFDYDNKDFLEIIETIFLVKQKLRIIWDFKNVIKSISKLEIIIRCIKEIIEHSKDNVSNMVYINNNIYNFNKLYKFNNLFDTLIVVDRNKEMKFTNESEIENEIWMLKSNSLLKYQNEKLSLFNDSFSNIPKDTDVNEFRKIVMSRIKDACDIDFCILHSSLKEQENMIPMNSYYGITKELKDYLLNDKEIITHIDNFNESIENESRVNDNILFDLNETQDSKLVERFKLLGVVSYMAIGVEYYDIAKGVFLIGRYKNNGEISKNNIEYLKLICKTAFYLIHDHKKNYDMKYRLIENEKLRVMGEMAAGITHDINNILTPILGSVQLLKDKIKEKENLKLLSVIEICAYDGMNITNKVKRLTQKDKGNFEIFNIDSAISDAIDLTKSKWLTGSIFKGIKIDIIKSLKSNEVVQGNITEIREVFINIIANAIDAMPKGGKIEVITRNNAKSAIIEVKDNGIGMNKEIQKRIFEPFFTTKGNNGSGLGLSISYNIVISHKGSMEIRSEENVGTSFIVKLPICGQISKSDDEELSNVIDFEGNILVIDDQEQIRNVVSSMIKSITKCKIKTCGCDNLDSELKRRNYDIIICDFTMPTINGFQVAEKIKEINNNTYFCLMTGWVGSFEGQKMNNVDFVLHKPINKKSLKQMFSFYTRDIRNL